MTAREIQATAPPSLQRCGQCGHELAETDTAQVCPSCGGLLELRHAPPPVSGAALRALLDARCGSRSGVFTSGVWRFRELVLPSAADADVLSYPEGDTPLLKRASVSAWTGSAELVLKHEGHNPTGSFKDRGMTVGVTHARRIRATAVSCASTGNTGASLAAYAALAGVPAIVLVPRGQVALGKLTQLLA